MMHLWMVAMFDHNQYWKSVGRHVFMRVLMACFNESRDRSDRDWRKGPDRSETRDQRWRPTDTSADIRDRKNHRNQE